MKYAYPAIFTEEDGAILVSIPDLPGAHSFGEDLTEAANMAKDAAETWLDHMEKARRPVPSASTFSEIEAKKENANSFVNYIFADTDEFRRKNDCRAVKKTLSIPAWLNYKAVEANAPFSQILQEGLKKYLNI